MRVSTVTMYEQSTASINRQQNDFLKVGQQVASGRRVVNPSDDPQAASRAVGVDQKKPLHSSTKTLVYLRVTHWHKRKAFSTVLAMR